MSLYFIEFSYVTIIVILYTQEICSKYGVVAYTDIKEGESEVGICRFYFGTLPVLGLYIHVHDIWLIY